MAEPFRTVERRNAKSHPRVVIVVRADHAPEAAPGIEVGDHRIDGPVQGATGNIYYVFRLLRHG